MFRTNEKYEVIAGEGEKKTLEMETIHLTINQKNGLDKTPSREIFLTDGSRGHVPVPLKKGEGTNQGVRVRNVCGSGKGGEPGYSISMKV